MDSNDTSSANEVIDSAALLARARGGDQEAINLFVTRHLPSLRGWARGRLPAWARDIADTDDLVQETLVRALGRLARFEPEGAGFPAYLRQIYLNLVRDEIRKAGRRPGRDEVADDLVDSRPTPLEATMGRDAMNRYKQALSRLSVEHQAAIALRLEMGLDYGEVGTILGERSANAARSLVVRAVARLAEAMEP